MFLEKKNHRRRSRRSSKNQNLALWASHKCILKYSLSIKFIGHKWQNNLFSKSLCMSLTWYLRADKLLYSCLQWGHGRFAKCKVLQSFPIPFLTVVPVDPDPVAKSFLSHIPDFDVPGTVATIATSDLLTAVVTPQDFLIFFICFALNKLIFVNLLIRLSLLLFAFRKNISTFGVNVKFSHSIPFPVLLFPPPPPPTYLQGKIMCTRVSNKPKVTLADLIQAAICKLQERNGVTACEIGEFIAKKRCCSVEQLLPYIKSILCNAVVEGILCEKNDCYRIAQKYDDPQPSCDREEEVSICDEESVDESCDFSDDDHNRKLGVDPCRCLNLSRECLSEEEEYRCGQCPPKCPKKKKCK